METFIWTAFE